MLLIESSSWLVRRGRGVRQPSARRSGGSRRTPTFRRSKRPAG